ncbi:MAG: hypothetical protein HQ568_09960, partial [Calditrichaeota bacterium]|nr:hypothetical protein [Calditrichota bacterium]
MKKLLYLMTLLVLVSVSFVACLEEDSNPSTPTTDPVLAAALVDSANRILEIVLFNEINGEDPEKPSDIDLTQPYNLYVQAVDHDPENPNANFGAGILELVMLSQDAQVNDFFDKVKDFAENGEFFIAEENSSILNSPRPKFEINKVTLPVVSALHTPANLISSIDADTPLISELQQIFMDRILPRMNNAIEYLTAVTENEDFRFDVSAKMQGDVNEDPVELDLTEVYASLSFLEIQKAMLLGFCAYDYSMSEYTGTEMLRAFTPGSSFMSLYNNGTDRMR